MRRCISDLRCIDGGSGIACSEAFSPVFAERSTSFSLGERVAIFVDGCFWHGCPVHGTWPKQNAAYWRAKIDQNKRRDRDTDERLREAGWHVVRFWEHEDLEQAAEKIRATISKLRRTGPVPTNP